MKIIPLTRGMFTIVDDADYPKLIRYKWLCSTRGYAVRTRSRKLGGGSIFMHRDIIKPPKDRTVDHINGLKLDNRRSNLRTATQQQNSWNTRLKRLPGCGYHGVRPTASGKFLSRIYHNRKYYHLGTFDTALKAHAAYKAAAIRIRGKFSPHYHVTTAHK